MVKDIQNKCDKVIENYREAKDSLRFDGDCINHLCAVIYGVYERDIPAEDIKYIRKKIKNDTSRVSYFRGDILYIVSILIAKEKDIDLFIKNMIEIYEKLIESGFKESQYLVMTAFSIAKYINDRKLKDIIDEASKIFCGMKKKYENITSEDDYLQCTLLALNDKKWCSIESDMDSIMERIKKLKDFSLNSVQALTCVLLLDDSNQNICRIEEFIRLSSIKKIKLSYQIMPFLGGIKGIEDMEKYINEANEVIQYLVGEEYEYGYYMDKSMVIEIALAILEINEDNKYLEELFCISIYWFILSKNQGIIEEVLAE